MHGIAAVSPDILNARPLTTQKGKCLYCKARGKTAAWDRHAQSGKERERWGHAAQVLVRISSVLLLLPRA